MKVFVSGATGFQGGNIAQQLIKNGHSVTTLKRSEGGIPSSEIEVVKGGLEHKEALNKALKPVDAAVYTFPLVFDIDLAEEYTSNFISAAQEAKVPLVVFNAGFDLTEKGEGKVVLEIKAKIKRLLNASDLEVITLVPDVYLDNISAPWSIPVIRNNSIVPYPVASGKKIPWISHKDLSKYVAAAVEKPELSGKVLPIGGNLFTGEEITAAIASKIGQELHYAPLTPDEFEKQIAPVFGALAGKEISNLYRYAASNREQIIAKDFKHTQDLLGVVPETLTEWVSSVNWKLPV